jgi:hypothetical protein
VKENSTKSKSKFLRKLGWTLELLKSLCWVGFRAADFIIFRTIVWDIEIWVIFVIENSTKLQKLVG